MSKSIRYQPDIDGLRAIAITAVLVFHFAPALLPGGFLGVDVFFVISGYLITSILDAETSAGTFTLRGFLERRVRRIIPAVVFLLACLVAAAWLLSTPWGFREYLARQCAYVLLMISNVKFYSQVGDGYWEAGGPGQGTPLLHTWSLAVEEQFYLLYPLAFMALGKLRRPAVKIAVLGVMLGASLVLCVSKAGSVEAFYLPQYRAWELLCGAIAAVVVRGRGAVQAASLAAKTVSTMGLAAVLASLLVFGHEGLPGPKTLLPVLGATAYIIARGSDGWVFRLLSAPPMLFWGRASYSIYLWHWPAWLMGASLALAMDWPAARHLAVGIGLALALVSYRWVEPFGKRTRHLLKVALVSMGLLVGGVYLTFKAQRSAGLPERSTWHGNLYTLRPVGYPTKKRSATKAAIPSGTRPADWWKAPVLTTNGPVGAVLLGDSHALMWAHEIHLACEGRGLAMASFAADGLSPSLVPPPASSVLAATNWGGFNEARLDFIGTHKPKVVCIVVRYDHYSERRQQEIADLATEIRRRSGSSSLLFLEQPPVLPIGNANAADFVEWRERLASSPSPCLPEGPDPAGDQARESFKRLVKSIPGSVWVETRKHLSEARGIRVVLPSGLVSFLDDDHVSSEGASLAGADLRAALQSAWH